MFATLMAIAVVGGGAPLHFDCSGPVTVNMSAGTILAKFGQEARRGIFMGDDVLGVGRKPVKGVILYPDDPARRLEIAFWDEAQTTVESITAEAQATAWTGPLGLHAGSTLAEVVTANGHNFSITGFHWNYGGYISNFWGGKLLKPAGGCAVQIRFAPAAGVKVSDEVVGEQDLNSTMPLVKAADPHIDRLSIGWPLPVGVRASAR